MRKSLLFPSNKWIFPLPSVLLLLVLQGCAQHLDYSYMPQAPRAARTPIAPSVQKATTTRQVEQEKAETFAIHQATVSNSHTSESAKHEAKAVDDPPAVPTPAVKAAPQVEQEKAETPVPSQTTAPKPRIIEAAKHEAKAVDDPPAVPTPAVKAAPQVEQEKAETPVPSQTTAPKPRIIEATKHEAKAVDDPPALPAPAVKAAPQVEQERAETPVTSQTAAPKSGAPENAQLAGIAEFVGLVEFNLTPTIKDMNVESKPATTPAINPNTAPKSEVAETGMHEGKRVMEPAQEWKVQKGSTVRKTVEAWAEAAGFEVDWLPEAVDFRILGDYTLKGEFTDALNGLFNGIGGVPFRASFNTSQKLVIVEENT